MSPPITDLVSQDAEQAVLGALLLEPDSLPGASSLRPADFSSKSHARIFAAILALEADGETIDPVVVVRLLQERGELDGIGGSIYVAELVGSSAGAANLPAYVRIVRELSIRRLALAKLAEAQEAILSGRVPVTDAVADLASPSKDWRQAISLGLNPWPRCCMPRSKLPGQRWSGVEMAEPSAHLRACQRSTTA